MRRVREIEPDPDMVTLYIWLTPEFYFSRNGVKRYGHIALKTHRGGPDGEGIYVSFWPSLDDDEHYLPESIKDFSENGGKGHMRVYNYDCCKCGTHENYKIHIPGLDIDKIHSEFEKICDEPLEWSTFGSGFLTLAWPNISNCAAVVARLLKAGGVRAALSPGLRNLRFFLGNLLCSASGPIIGLTLAFLRKSSGTNIKFSDVKAELMGGQKSLGGIFDNEAGPITWERVASFIFGLFVGHLQDLLLSEKVASNAFFSSMITWLGGMYLSASSHYTGSFVLPFVAGLYTIPQSYEHGSGICNEVAHPYEGVGIHLRFDSLFFHGVSLLTSVVPALLPLCCMPIRLLLTDPETIRMAVTSIPDVQVETVKERTWSEWATSCVMQNMWPLVAIGAAGAVFYRTISS